MEDGEERDKSKNPYFAFFQDQEQSYRPDFFAQAENEDQNSGENSSTASKLRDAERLASGKARDSKDGNSVSGARQAENNILSEKSNHINKVVGRGAAGRLKSLRGSLFGDKTDKKGRKKSFARRMLPMMSVCTILFGGGGMMMQAQMAMPFSLVSQLQGNFDSINVSNKMRSRTFIHMQMGTRDNGKVKNCIKPHYFKEDEFKISESQRKSLSNNGIEVVEENGITKMKYTDAGGTEIEVKASEFDDVYKTNPEFRKSYNDGSKTWRGSVAAWYDKTATKFFNFLGIKRGVWSNFKRGASSEEDFRNTITGKQKNQLDGEIDSTKRKYVETTDKDGNKVQVRDDSEKIKTTADLSADDVKVDASTGKADTTEVTKKLKGLADGSFAKVSGIASAGANLTCMVAEVVGGINLIVMAYQIAQLLKVVNPMLEAIQKAQAGDGDGAPIHEVANALVRDATEYYGSPIDTNSGRNDIDNGSEMKLTTKTTGSAMSSDAVTALYADRPVNTNDPSVNSFNIFKSVNQTMAAFGNSMKSFAACTAAKLAAAGIDLATDVAAVVGCIFSLGIGCAVDILVESAISVGVSELANIIVGIITPYVVSVLTRGAIVRLAGEDLGNAIVDIVHYQNGKMHEFSGGSAADKTHFTQFVGVRNQVLAEQAEYDRQNRSPFDITSSNTFAGALFAKAIPIFSHSGNISTAISNGTSVLGGSITSLLPKADAITAAETALAAVEQSAENCPYLDSIGAVGDAFCNPYVITDMTTIEADPAEVTDVLAQNGQIEIDSSGEVNIKKDSELAKWAIYCGERTSPFGMTDQNIKEDFTVGSTGSTHGDSVVGAIPIVGDTIDMLSDKKYLENMDYITGESCVAGNDGGGNSPSWDTTKVFQRFAEDQRLAENMGLTEKNAVTAFLDEYHKEHPIDTSYEGTLARYSGLKKDTVVALLDFLDVASWVAEYDPTDYAPYPKVEEEKTEYRLEEENNYDGGALAVVYYFDFEDRRTQNYTA